MCSGGGGRGQVSGVPGQVWGGGGAGGGPTWAGAVRVHGGLVALVVAVVLSVALPLAGAQAAPVGAAELVGATGRVLWGRRGRRLAWAPSIRHGRAGSAPRTAPGSPHSGDSSEPSAQSRSWSHTKCLGMHWRFWHMNSRSSQVLLYTVDGGGMPLSPRPHADRHPRPSGENRQSTGQGSGRPSCRQGSATDP